MVDAVSETVVDLVITDFDMPVLDGLEAAEAIARKSSVPIILISGYSDTSHVVPERESVTLALRKPLSMESLGQAIDRAWEIANRAGH